jgi:hypothetical protein
MEWWKWVAMMVGFWIMDFQVLETEVQVMMDFVGERKKILVAISSGRESQQVTLVVSDIAAWFQRGRGQGFRELGDDF